MTGHAWISIFFSRVSAMVVREDERIPLTEEQLAV